MSELRVAFAMGGGVSLGAFCGGALGEVVKQLRDNRKTTYDRVRFDVFSGASAGAMSLGLLVHALAHPDFAARSDAVLEQQRRAWVEMIDIQDLIPDPNMTKVASILDRGAVDKIARKLLLWQPGTAPVTDALGPRVLLACTLSNLNGIPVDGRKAGQGEAFLDALQTTFYADLRVFDLRLDAHPASQPASRDTWIVRDVSTQPGVWDEVAASCIAAGAFPMAFEPVVLERSRHEYGSLWPKRWNDLPSEFPFSFSDGGMFDNEPLREVMNLVGIVDGQSEESGDTDFHRVVIFIDPNLSGTTEELSLDFYRRLEVRDPDNTLWKLGQLFEGRHVAKRTYVERMVSLATRLVGAVAGQASFKDWLAAEKVNNRLHWRENLRELLSQLLALVPDEEFETKGGDGAALSAACEEGLKSVLREKGGMSVRANPELDLQREVARIHREEEGRLGTLSEGKGRAYVHLLSLADQVAGLRARRHVDVVGIAPVKADGSRVELAGDFAANFGGFFQKHYREYDYAVGRARAGALLARSGLLDDINEVEADPKPLPVDPSIATTPESKRLITRIKDVIGDFLDVRINWFLKLDKVAIAIGKGMLGGVLKRALGGDTKPEVRVVMRLEIVPGTAGQRFKLAGKSGRDAVRGTQEGSVEVIETLLFFTPATERIRGPHVCRWKGQQVLELIHRRLSKTNEHRRIAIPSPIEIRKAERMGYGKIVARVEWAKLKQLPEDSVAGDNVVSWSARETLVGLRLDQ